MVINLQEFEALSAPFEFDPNDVEQWCGDDLFDAEVILDDVQSVADALDRVRRLFERVGPMTLRAQVAGVPTPLICAALAEIARTGERALERYLEP